MPTGLPVLIDGDTGYGGVLNAMQMVRLFEMAGAAAVHIEDQRLPKKCGHINDKQLVSTQEMAEKVAAAKQAATDMAIVARTDAVATEGLDAAMERAHQYVAVGADARFPEALTSAEMFKAAFLDTPLLANMTEFRRTPMLSAAEFEAMDTPISKTVLPG